MVETLYASVVVLLGVALFTTCLCSWFAQQSKAANRECELLARFNKHLLEDTGTYLGLLDTARLEREAALREAEAARRSSNLQRAANLDLQRQFREMQSRLEQRPA